MRDELPDWGRKLLGGCRDLGASREEGREHFVLSGHRREVQRRPTELGGAATWWLSRLGRQPLGGSLRTRAFLSIAGMMPSSFPLLPFLITLKPVFEWFKSLLALNTSPPR